jgi:gamma-glutamyl-gamma-aminobutyraldehyde dehydrogenase/4-guanidinobutyraldehyde dehydrogenase/NAD-dependent aldehyde dehydrogenase
MCTAGSRLLIDRRVHDQVLDLVLGHARARRLGDPLDADTDVGALVEERHMQRVLGYIDSGCGEGATLAIGGARARAESGGFYVEPTVFTDVTPGMCIAREEIFGPVLATMRFDGVEEAIGIANDSIYGLAAAVWTRDIDTAIKTSRRLRAGMVYVNCYDADDITVPFGGYRQSGNGRDKSLHAFDKYTELKTTWIAVE